MLNNLVGGAALSFSVLGVLAIANVLTSYVLPGGQTITGLVDTRLGMNGGSA